MTHQDTTDQQQDIDRLEALVARRTRQVGHAMRQWGESHAKLVRVTAQRDELERELAARAIIDQRAAG